MTNESASAVTREAETERDLIAEFLDDEAHDAGMGVYVRDVSRATKPRRAAELLRSSVRGASEVDAREIVLRHRRHVEQSPGVGPRVQGYAIDVLDDVLRDLPAATRSTEEMRPSNVATCGCYYDGTVIYCAEHRGETSRETRTGAEEADAAWAEAFALDTRLEGTIQITTMHAIRRAVEASIAAYESRRGR